MIQLKLIFSIIRTNIFTSIGLAFLYSFLFVVFFLVGFSYFFVGNFFAATYDKNFLEVSTRNKTDSQNIDYAFVEKFQSQFPNSQVYPSFFIRIPTMMRISFFGKTLETDTFLMGYPSEYIKDKNYRTISHENTQGKIGLSISNETLLILKNFLFSELSTDTLGFFEGDIIFGRSSIFGKTGDTQPVSEQFYIEGVSNTLPIYALAMNIEDAFAVMEQFGKDKNTIGLHRVHIFFDNEEEKKMYTDYITQYSNSVGIPYILKDSGLQAQAIKDKYEQLFFMILGLGGIFFLICIIVITELSLQNLIHKSKNIITVSLYSQIPKVQIFFLFVGIFICIFLGVMCILGGLCFLFLANGNLILSQLGEYSLYVLTSIVQTGKYFFFFVVCFCCYYLCSLVKKLSTVKI